MKRNVIVPSTAIMALFLALAARESSSQKRAGERVVSHDNEANLSKPTYGVKMEHNVPIPMSDGVTLSTSRIMAGV